MKLKTLLAILALLPLAAVANAQCVGTEDGSGTQCFTLVAGQHTDVGTVCVTAVGDDLEITYSTDNGWKLSETHLWVGTDIAGMPQTRKGSPIPGQFPYPSGDISGSTSYTSLVSLDSIGFSCPSDDQAVLVAAHAVVKRGNGNGGRSETAWSDGARITEKGQWATLSSLSLGCDCDGGGGGGDECEMAFAYRGTMATCFLDIDEDGDNVGDFSTTGWTNGPFGPGNYTFQIYAGASQCSPGTGTFVGYVFVNYDGEAAQVDYEIQAPFTLEETHLYLGNEILPRNESGFFTVAPGQYPESHPVPDSPFSDSYFVNAAGDVNLVAHATVCGFGNGGPQ